MALLAVGLALVLSVFRVQADNWIQSAQGVAVHGFDVVNYFETNSAKRGSSEFAVEWQGAVWHFVNARHRALFEQNPERYAPQYGGRCANGLSDGHVVGANPRNWRIIDGRLYFFFSRWGREQWASDVENQRELAKSLWLDVQQSAAE